MGLPSPIPKVLYIEFLKFFHKNSKNIIFIVQESFVLYPLSPSTYIVDNPIGQRTPIKMFN